MGPPASTAGLSTGHACEHIMQLHPQGPLGLKKGTGDIQVPFSSLSTLSLSERWGCSKMNSGWARGEQLLLTREGGCWPLPTFVTTIGV